MTISNKTFLKAAAALTILLVSGASVFRRPDYELTYDLPLPITACTTSDGCISAYRMILGNTGRMAQNVSLKLKAAPLREPALPLKVKNFGVSLHPFTQKETGNTLIIDLGTVEPGKRVESTFALFSKNQGAVLNPGEVFEGIAAQRGRVIRGSPEWINFSRIMYTIF